MVLTTSIDKKNSILMFEHFQMISSSDLNLKIKFKLTVNLLGIENKNSPQKLVMSN